MREVNADERPPEIYKVVFSTGVMDALRTVGSISAHSKLFTKTLYGGRATHEI
jgi:hypothetical protein